MFNTFGAAIRLLKEGRVASVALLGTDKLHRQVTKHIGSNQAEVFAQSDSPAKQLLGNALLNAHSRPTPDEDTQVFEQIEHRRRELNSGDRSVGRTAAKCSPEQGRFLYYLIQESAADTVLELGTSVGISGAYEASAAARNNGHLTTLEGSPERVEIASETFETLGYENVDIVEGRFSETLPDVLARLEKIDIALIDGHHEEQATKQYWQDIKPFLADNAVIVFDDIRWSWGMAQAWDWICSDPAFAPLVDIHGYGIGVYSRDMDTNPSKISF